MNKDITMKNVWHGMSDERVAPEDFMVCIEIPKGSKRKYELDKETGLMMLDRILATSTMYPANYGFIPRTISDDGDPLDVMVLSSESIDPFTLVRCYPIGVVTMIDGGEKDDKIIAIPFKDPLYNYYQSLETLPNHIIDELIHFLKVYKNLEATVTEVSPIKGYEAAIEAIKEGKEKYAFKFNMFENDNK